MARALGAKSLVITVTEPWTSVVAGESAFTYPIDDDDKNVEANASKILASSVDIARKLGISCDTLHVKGHYPADGIVATAKQRGCDIIVMASHGRRGLSRLLLGSVPAVRRRASLGRALQR